MVSSRRARRQNGTARKRCAAGSDGKRRAAGTATTNQRSTGPAPSHWTDSGSTKVGGCKGRLQGKRRRNCGAGQEVRRRVPRQFLQRSRNGSGRHRGQVRRTNAKGETGFC